MNVKFEQDDIEAIAETVTVEVLKALNPLLPKGKADTDPLMDIGECSKYLGVKEQWLYKRVSFKEIPYIKAGRFLKFRRSAIDRWLEENQVPQVNLLSAKLKAVK